MSQKGRYSGEPTGGNQLTPAPATRNGRIALARLRRLETQEHLGTGSRRYLTPAAAECTDRMVRAAARDGVTLRLLTGYRDLAGQVAAREHWASLGMPAYAAPPGTSNHGWGTATDWDRSQPGAVAWLREHGAEYGWDHPVWAGDGAGVEEPWHFQFIVGFGPEDCPPAREPIRVYVNGALVPDAAGYVEQGASHAWLRPIALALNADIRAPGAGVVLVRLRGVERFLPCEVREGKAWVPLAAFEKFDERTPDGRVVVRVAWDPDARAVRIKTGGNGS